VRKRASWLAEADAASIAVLVLSWAWTLRRAAHPSGYARCGAGSGCSAIKYQSLWTVFSTDPASPKYKIQPPDSKKVVCKSNICPREIGACQRGSSDLPNCVHGHLPYGETWTFLSVSLSRTLAFVPFFFRINNLSSLTRILQKTTTVVLSEHSRIESVTPPWDSFREAVEGLSGPGFRVQV